MTIKEIESKLKNELDEKRYKHSISVADEAVRLAGLYGGDKEKAYLAGLIHDCAKCLPYDKAIELAKKYGCVLDDETLACPGVVHAPIGAVVAEHEYGISDTEILDAIRYHTVARKGMTLLDKIIYLADMTEPYRDFNGVENLRKLCNEDIDLAFCEALRRSLQFNIEKGNIMHPNTLYAWNEMCIKNKHKSREENK
ncbi:MAG: bis(5'-nucleosyl)-tetraphosphatase (symmetrical) YqeK [Clostridia bacterium]|nr:bis(5'-nucleosyl)-tetraphosphatase (symmetrical) YqeK [Clostridia bacterium]